MDRDQVRLYVDLGQAEVAIQQTIGDYFGKRKEVINSMIKKALEDYEEEFNRTVYKTVLSELRARTNSVIQSALSPIFEGTRNKIQIAVQKVLAKELLNEAGELDG